MGHAMPHRARFSGLAAGLSAAVLLGLGACAPPPETIAATQVSPLKYQRMNCQALVTQVASMDQQLADLYTRQRSNQANDIFKGVFFLHPRATVVGPDLVPTIALTKGERDAANAVMQSRC